MQVSIIEKKTGKLVVGYPVSFRGLNLQSKLEDFYSTAWTVAVQDGEVDAAERDKYDFHAAEGA